MWTGKQRSGKTLIVGVCAALVFVGLSCASSSHPHAPAWTTEWHQTFAGPSGHQVSTQNWTYVTGRNQSNGEVEVLTASSANVSLDGAGDLGITALHENGVWTSGRIQSTRRFGAAAGHELMVSASIKQPWVGNGLGYWPAFWMLGPGQWPENGEIDIMEDVNTLDEHSASLHCGNLTSYNSDGTYGPCHEHTGISSGLQACRGCQSGYHTYSVVIDRRHQAHEQVIWYLDGREFFHVAEQQIGTRTWTQAFDHKFTIIFDLAIGGFYPNSRCGCTTPTAPTTSGGRMSIRSLTIRSR